MPAVCLISQQAQRPVDVRAQLGKQQRKRRAAMGQDKADAIRAANAAAQKSSRASRFTVALAMLLWR